VAEPGLTAETPPQVAETVLRAQTQDRTERTEVIFEPGPTVLARLGDSLLRIAG
jgi:hypothetical protein